MFIGIDVGGTTIKYGVILKNGEIVKKGQMPTIHEKEGFLQSITALIKSLQQEAIVDGVGISAPGIIQKDGTMITAGSIKSLYGINLKQEIEERVKLPVMVENDANAAAIAEKWLGHAQNCENYQDAVEIFQRGAQGEVVANQVLAQFFQDLSVGLLNLISTFDPELILIGGGISENDGFMARLEENLCQLKARHESIGYLEGRTIAPIRRAKLKNDAGMIGAVYQLMNQRRK